MTSILDRMPGRPKKKEPTEPVRVPSSYLKRVRRVAAHLGVDPGDYIAKSHGGQLDRDEAKMLQDIAKERPAND